MRDQQVNTFGKGMMKDLSATTPQAGSYVDAQNIRIISDGSGGENASGIVIDVKGNEKVLDLLTTNISANLTPPAVYTAWVASGSLTIDDLTPSGGGATWPADTYLHVFGHIINNTGANKLIPGYVLSQSEYEIFTYIVETFITGAGEAVSVFDLGEINVPLYDYLAELTNISYAPIIGYTLIRTTLVLFSRLTFSNADLGTRSAILSCNLEDETLSAELVYMGDLGFDPDYPIEAIGRYEMATSQKVYWTDNLNPVRAINIAKDVSDLKPSSLNLLPAVQLEPIRAVKVTQGGSLPAGIYQYAYRLRSSEGAETRFTPICNPIHVVKSAGNYWKYSEDSDNLLEINGTSPGDITSKSVHLSVEITDDRYSTIEFAAVYRKNKLGVDDVYIFKEAEVELGTVTALHNSTLGETILLEELTAFTLSVETARTLGSVDNRLFMGGVKEKDSDLSFNSRAYRYKRTGIDAIHYPYTETGNVATYVSTPDSLITVTEDEEAINPFNDFDGNNIDSTKKYKYRKDGVTLGGEGPNVSYKFIKKRLTGDSISSKAPESAPFVSGEMYDDTLDTSTFTEFKGDYKSGIVNSLYRSYHRDEVYRFGIVLHDLKGNAGFVNWVADIKFPAVDDIHVDISSGTAEPVEGIYNFSLSQTDISQSGASYYTHTDSGVNLTESEENTAVVSDETNALGEIPLGESVEGGLELDPQSGGKHYLFALGVEFTVNIPEDLKPLTTGYSIVRVKRESADKTTLGMGMANYFSSFKTTNDITGDRRMGFNRNLYYQLAGGGSYHYYYGMPFKYALSIDSPEFAFSKEYPTKGNNDYLQVCGSLSNGHERRAFRSSFSGDSYTNQRKYLSHMTGEMRKTSVVPYVSVGRAEKLSKGGEITSAVWPNYSDSIDRPVYNFTLESSFTIQSDGNLSTTSQGSGIIGMGEETLYVQVADGETTTPPHIDFEDYLTYYGQEVGESGPNNTSTDNIIQYEKLLVAYRRDLGEGESNIRYGGPTKQARNNNIYISTGHFSGSSNTTQKVFGGDTYVTFYDIEKTKKYSPSIDGEIEGVDTHEALEGDYKKNTETYCYAYPVETSYNTALRGGWHFANKDCFADDCTPLNQFIYHDVYSAENDLEVFIPKPTSFDADDDLNRSFGERILFSEGKINREGSDSWRLFKLESFRDLDSEFGPLSKLSVFKDSLYFLQSNALGKLLVNPVSTVLDESSTSIVLGSGSVLHDHSYISTSTGVESFKEVITTDKGIYWIDKKTKKAYAFRADGLTSISDTHGMKAWFASNVNKTSSIVLGNDTINDEVLFSIDNKTLVFSEVLNKFTSFYPYGASIYINTYDRLFSVEESNSLLLGSKMFEHNVGAACTFYGTKTNSYIEFLVNKHPTHTKVFDIIEWYTASVGNKFEGGVFTNNIDTVIDDLSESASKERMTRMPVPRTAESVRFRDAYMKVKLTTSQEFTLHYVKTTFRISKR